MEKLKKAKTVRFQVELLERAYQRMGENMAKTGLRTKRELMDHLWLILEGQLRKRSREKQWTREHLRVNFGGLLLRF